MSRVLRAAACIGAGGAFAAAVNVPMDAFLISPAEANTNVEYCAAALGSTAVQSSTVPRECTDFTLSFESQTYKVSSKDPLNGRRTLDVEKTYTLPSADDFRRSFSASETAVQNYESSRRANRGIAVVLGAVAALSFYFGPSKLEKLNQKLAGRT